MCCQNVKLKAEKLEAGKQVRTHSLSLPLSPMICDGLMPLVIVKKKASQKQKTAWES